MSISSQSYQVSKLSIKLYLKKGSRIYYKFLPLTKFCKGAYFDFDRARAFGWEDYIQAGSFDFKNKELIKHAYRLTSNRIIRVKIVNKVNDVIWDLGCGWII